MKALFILVLAVCLFDLSHQHICVVNPHQRGPLNITEGGDNTCYKKVAPCGGLPASSPVVTINGGESYTVVWQQNFNHYQPGYPGVMDISYATNSNPVESDFVTIAVIPDYNAHYQAAQRNYTYEIPTFPDVDCANCVLRMRYMPHKPTEDIFYQCSDISVQSSKYRQKQQKLTMPKRSFYAVMTDWVVTIDPVSGDIDKTFKLDFTVEMMKQKLNGKPLNSDDSTPYITDQVGAVTDSGILYQTASFDDIGSVPDTLLALDLKRYSVTPVTLKQANPVFGNPIDPIDALVYGEDTLYGFQIVPSNQPGKWYYVLCSIDTTTGEITSEYQLPPDDTWVNYQWSFYGNGSVFLLTGNENDPYGLSTKLYQFYKDHNTGNWVNQVMVPDNSQYTISGLHFDALEICFYALSPGLVNQADPFPWVVSDWTLIRIDPSGHVTPLKVISSGEYLNYYGGYVVGGLEPYDRNITHILYTPSGAGVVVTIDLLTLDATFSEPQQDIDNLHNFVGYTEKWRR